MNSYYSISILKTQKWKIWWTEKSSSHCNVHSIETKLHSLCYKTHLIPWTSLFYNHKNILESFTETSQVMLHLQRYLKNIAASYIFLKTLLQNCTILKQSLLSQTFSLFHHQLKGVIITFNIQYLIQMPQSQQIWETISTI
jgi:hypothetical protein